MTFAAGFLLLLWVVASLLLNGIAVLRCGARLRGLPLIGYGAGAGVVLHAVLGLAIAGVPAARWALLAVLAGLTLLSAIYLFLRRIPQELFLELSRAVKISLGLWALFLVIGLALLHIDVRLPEPLPDGPYVFKTHTTNVKIQYLTTLPADNYIPFAVTEFFLRGVSFKNARPVMPANEVSNRTILMSLVAIPFRAALGAPYDHPEIGTFHYLGRDWPDVSKLDRDGAFDQFSVIGLVLNSLLLLGALVFCNGLGAGSVLPVATLIYVTNAYFIGQTIYTWPKALAGFFILLAWQSIRAGHGALVVAALLGIAFHAHPYTLAFFGWVALFYLVQWWRRKSGPSSLLVHLLIFTAIVLPWIIWTRFVLQIPSDLIAQNFTGPGTEMAWASPMNFIWIRLYNLFFTICSTIFALYPFDLSVLLDRWLVSLPGVVGLVLIYPALARCVELRRPRWWLWFGFLGPSLSIVAIYSCPALPVLHGLQAPLAVLLFLGVWWLSEHCSRRVYLRLVAVQLLLNLGTLVARGLTSGIRF